MAYNQDLKRRIPEGVEGGDAKLLRGQCTGKTPSGIVIIWRVKFFGERYEEILLFIALQDH